jgi:hypothetical protein
LAARLPGRHPIARCAAGLADWANSERLRSFAVIAAVKRRYALRDCVDDRSAGWVARRRPPRGRVFRSSLRE